MTRGLFGSLALMVCLFGAPVMAQTNAEVDAARLLHIDGDFETALQVLMPAAEAGNPVAQNVVGVSYESGMGLPQDINIAIQWYEAAAEQGLGKAMHNLGVIYRHGREGIEARPAEARALFERALEAGYEGSYSNLGSMLENGEGGGTDTQQALQLYQAGAALDDRFCLNNLGHFYRLGIELDEDHEKARRLYGRAALLGLADGYNNLGVMNEHGMAGESYPQMAAMLYRRAMALGNVQSAINLAALIQEGRLPGHGDVEAVAHCLWADARGSPKDEGCTELSDSLTDEARDRARSLAQQL